ncbi:STAS domain-containing protein [Streptomyces sp. NPDC049813]|uniref:STAS domain-containing protein n=1 Tax=Streptomyces sp. NPDC049813 TaxID=3365597 RepID=UPI0037B37B6E
MPASVQLAPVDIADRTLLTFPAEIDLGNARFLLAEACALADERAGECRAFILDLTRTVFIDSQGVWLLCELRTYLLSRYGSLMRMVVPGDGLVRRVLTLAQTRRDVPLHDSVEDALRACEE